MTWNEWVTEAAYYFEKEWGLSESFSRPAATLWGYLWYYGCNPIVTSGFRTPEKQAELVRRYNAGDPGVIYPPAKNSRHLTGNAVDISTDNHELAAQIKTALGFKNIAGDDVHCALKYKGTV